MKQLLFGIILIVSFAIMTLFLSHAPITLVNGGDSLLTVAIRYVSTRDEVCRKATEEEKAKMLAHMRREEICERERKDSRVKLWVDGKEILNQQVKPLGLRSDGLSVLLHSFPVKSGDHEVKVSLQEDKIVSQSNVKENEIAEFSQEMNFKKNKRYLVEYQKEVGFKFFFN